MRLDGKVAIVTGAGQGFGRAIALTLASEGAEIVVNDVVSTRAENVAEEIRRLGRQAELAIADVADSKAVNHMVRQTLDRFRRIDILINNAGVARFTPTHELSEEEWDRTVDINLKGQFLCSQAVGRQMMKQKGGKIVNIASLAAHNAQPGLAAYCASKGGVVELTKVLAVEWAKDNINVNAVSPGMADTPMIKVLEKVSPVLVERRLRRVPLRRLVKPQHIANIVLFLASPESDDITGQVIIVDCGVGVLHPGWLWPEELA